MSENQLREAYTFMKQGDKKSAARLVQDVLREDKSNANAWWLFAHILEDEEKIVKSLERVVAINPEHLGARKKLAEMRPEYAHLYQSASPDEKEKAKAGQNSPEYWAKLYNPTKQNKNSSGFVGQIINNFGWYWRIRLVALLILLVVGTIFGIYSFVNQQVTLPDTAGNIPEDVVKAYIEAIYREDANSLYAISCPDLHPEIAETVAGFGGINSSEVQVDLSQTSFYLYDYSSNNLAYVTVHGITIAKYGGQTLTVDWDKDASSEGVDFYGTHLRRSDGIWQICVEYYVPSLEHVED